MEQAINMGIGIICCLALIVSLIFWIMENKSLKLKTVYVIKFIIYVFLVLLTAAIIFGGVVLVGYIGLFVKGLFV